MSRTLRDIPISEHIPERVRLPEVSAVVPVLDSAAPLARLLTEISPWVSGVIVVDGGSSDGSGNVARAASARVVDSPPGRGNQLAVGCEAASGEWLLVLHADSMPCPGWSTEVADFIANPANRFRAGAFRLRYDENSPGARRTAALANLRSRFLGLPYGDQGLLLSREFYRAVGGFRPLPLMEDVDLVRRIGRRRIQLLAHSIITSAARYRRDGWWCRAFRNLLCLGLWFVGVRPERIARLYVGGGNK